MATIMYTLLATSAEPSFDLASIEFAGGDHLLVVQAVSEDGEVSEYSDTVVYSREHSEYVIRKTTLTAIADSVRAKTGKTDLILTEEIPTEIGTHLMLVPSESIIIESDGTYDVTTYASADVSVKPPLQEKTATENGDVTPDEGYYGLSKVTVDVPIPAEYKKMDSAVKDITTNGLHSTVKDADTFYGVVNVDVDPTLQEKTATENGEVLPDEGYDGLSKVNVDVPIPDGYIVPAGTISITANGTYDVTAYASAKVSHSTTHLITPDSSDRTVTRSFNSTISMPTTSYSRRVYFPFKMVNSINLPAQPSPYIGFEFSGTMIYILSYSAGSVTRTPMYDTSTGTWKITTDGYIYIDADAFSPDNTINDVGVDVSIWFGNWLYANTTF